MVVVVVAAIVFAVFRARSYWGLAGLVPFGITALVALLGSGESGPLTRRRTFWVGMAGTLVLPFLVAISLNYAMWGYFMSRPSVDGRIVEARQI
jgi:hypothetical protein